MLDALALDHDACHRRSWDPAVDAIKFDWIEDLELGVSTAMDLYNRIARPVSIPNRFIIRLRLRF